MTEDELLTAEEEWHLAKEGDEAMNYGLTEWVAYRGDISIKEASDLLYGGRRP